MQTSSIATIIVALILIGLGWLIKSEHEKTFELGIIWRHFT